jgi:hypothetical protein
MLYRPIILACLGLLGSLVTAPRVWAEEPAKLATLLPARGGNTLSVIRVQDILKSARGKSEDWAGSYETQFLAGANVIPPWVDLVIRNSNIIPTSGQRTSLAVLVESTRPIDLARVAAHENGSISEVAGFQVVSAPAQMGFLVHLRPNTLGFLSPASRQDVRQWVAPLAHLRGLEKLAPVSTNNPPPVSPYLQKLLKSPAQIAIAIDLEDAFDPQAICTWLGVCAAVKESAPERAILEKVAPKLAGAKLEISIDSETEATITLEFLENIGAAAQTVKAVFLEVLAEQGTLLPEFETASAEVRADAVILRTKLSDASLRKLLGLLLSSTPATTTLQTLEASAQPVQPEAPKAPTPATKPSSPTPISTRTTLDPLERNRRYYRAVAQVVDDLRVRDRRATNATRTAVFHESAADRLERMSLEGIDRDLADFGLRTAANLRALAASMRGQSLRVDVGNQSVVYNAQFNPGGTGFGGFGFGGGFYNQQPTVNVTSNLQEVRQQQAQAVAAGADQRDQIWKMLDDDRAALRRTLLDRYKVDFDIDPRRAR